MIPSMWCRGMDIYQHQPLALALSAVSSTFQPLSHLRVIEQGVRSKEPSVSSVPLSTNRPNALLAKGCTISHVQHSHHRRERKDIDMPDNLANTPIYNAYTRAGLYQNQSALLSGLTTYDV